jgi:hypothetical protein
MTVRMGRLVAVGAMEEELRMASAGNGPQKKLQEKLNFSMWGEASDLPHGGLDYLLRSRRQI